MSRPSYAPIHGEDLLSLFVGELVKAQDTKSTLRVNSFILLYTNKKSKFNNIVFEGRRNRSKEKTALLLTLFVVILIIYQCTNEGQTFYDKYETQ